MLAMVTVAGNHAYFGVLPKFMISISTYPPLHCKYNRHHQV